MKTSISVQHGKKAIPLSQRQAELYMAMNSFSKPLTNVELRDLTGITWPTARMSELITKGIKIIKDWKLIINEHGEMVKVRTYLLVT